MSEKLSNNRSKFIDQIKFELSKSIDPKTAAILIIFHSLAYDSFAIHYIKSIKPYLLLKKWDSKLDNERYSLGIYNLDNIAIVDKEIYLSEIQINTLDDLVNKNLSTSELDGFILDGIDYSLEIFNRNTAKKLEWRDESQLNKELKELFKKLCELTDL